MLLAAEPTSEALLQRVAEGDSSAFEQLYGRYARAVLSVCQRVLRDRGSAEDAAQEAFASIHRRARSFDPRRGSASGWIFTVARNAATDIARRRLPVPLEQTLEVADESPSSEQRAIQAEDAFRLHAALELLPDREREVLSLAYFEERSQTEIAAVLQIPLGTVKTRTRSALRRLAERLAEEG